MSTMSTEEIGVNHLKTILAKTHIVSTNGILAGEKGVSWDGFISVFSDDTGKKESYFGKIPVQIKTIHQNDANNRFPIEKSDLVNYKKEGRIMYFYITLDKKERETIFYLPLQLWDIDNMLNKMGVQESKTYTFKRFPKQTNDIISVLYDFINESNLQKQLMPGIRSFKDLIDSKGNVPVSFDVTIPKNTPLLSIPKIIKEKQPYIKYKSEDTNIEYVVDRLVNSEIVIELKKIANIGFKNDYYFKKVSIRGDEKVFIIECSKLLNIIIKSKRVIFKYNFLMGGIDEQIKLARFFEKLIKTKSFYINTFEIKMTDEQVFLLNSKLSDRIVFLNRYDSLRKALHINKEPNFIIAEESDYVLFDKICTCVLEEKVIGKINLENGLAVVNMFGLRLLVCIISSENASFVMNWLDERYVKLSSPDNPNVNLSPYYYLESQNINWFLMADNIDIELIENSVFDSDMTIEKCSYVSNIVMNMISFYDKVGNQHILNVASRISNRLLKIQPDFGAVIINNIQICYRQNNISEIQKDKLRRIVEQNSGNPIIQFAAFVLLNEEQKAKEAYKDLGEDEKQLLVTWPIFHLFKSQAN